MHDWQLDITAIDHFETCKTESCSDCKDIAAFMNAQGINPFDWFKPDDGDLPDDSGFGAPRVQ